MILVALGANLSGPWGDPRATLERAVREIGDLPGIALSAVSSWYRSVAVPPSGQPDYINGVAALRGEADPAGLLVSLQRIEQAGGRVRSVANAARSLDLDIIAIGGLVRDRPDPILPHPRAAERGFVLLPLAEVAPAWVHPRSGLGVGRLVDQLGPDKGCEIAWPSLS